MLLTKSTTIIKIYVALALAAAAVLSPLALSWVPVVLLAWYLFQWRRPLSPVLGLLTQYFLFFALGLLFSLVVPPSLEPLFSLPVLILVVHSLEKSAATLKYRTTRRPRSLTGTAVMLLTVALAALLVSLAIASLTLLLQSVIALLFFTALGIHICCRFPVKPVAEARLQLRVLAGKEESVRVRLDSRTRIGGLLYIQTIQDWASVKTRSLSFNGGLPDLQMTVSPSLSGIRVVRLQGYAIDRWGLLQSRFEIEPVEILVIPRARYAEWLARKYLSGTRPGALPLLSSLGSLNGQRGLRQGLEYYGNRLYQPGDSLKNISWKHSSKYNELVSREYTEFQGQPAVILVNLTAGDAEEADKLAYNLVAAALTLAQEEIPAALAAYNREKVVVTTDQLDRSRLVLHCLQLVKEIEIVDNPIKYLEPPDINRLQSNLRRVSQADSPPARVLAGLLRMEYQSLSLIAKTSPCTGALSRFMDKGGSKATFVVISGYNHDAEALSFNTYILSRNGNSVINLD
ncbi:MAG: DUF58 domain-containing protein [Dehalococcoidales bacterium]|nr:DUF58 domain-containing protein [Dehalococcoidales bacterium]